jgi:hypothetical protein
LTKDGLFDRILGGSDNMKKILTLLLLLSISASFSACRSKVLKTGDIFFLNVYKVSSAKVNYNANPAAVLTLGSDIKKVEKIMGKGQAYPSAGGNKPFIIQAA